ncbi:MAG TPA: DUF5685 family protein [Candidatus Deferrimicrobium sp.]|nr:DUF5685 family protein [Candidatus Deferrimicrobium sp.]
MFGMLRVPKGYLLPQEQEVFQAHYCGVCHALGRSGFPGLRLATSYDGAALALFFSALSQQPIPLQQKPCPFSPWRKKAMPVAREEVFDFAAAASLGIAKLKAEDEIKDSKGSLKKTLLQVIQKYLSGKAPKWDEFAQVHELQTNAEEANEPWFDELAYPSGLLLGSLAERAARQNAMDTDLAYKVGENLGKWIYTWDALWDFADDQKQNRFNAISSAYQLSVPEPSAWPPEILAEVDFVLERCLEEVLANINMLNLGTPGEILAKLLTGAHNWHKRTYVKVFFQEEETYERLPRGWRKDGCQHAEKSSSRTEQVNSRRA